MPRPLHAVAEAGGSWTFGAEHEFADVDTRFGWDGYGRDPEPNIVNSNGVAADPALKDWPLGAEANTPPSDTPGGQAELLAAFIRRHPEATVNWRCGLHIHIRVPGLRDSLMHLKRLQTFVRDNAEVYDLVDPLPREDPVRHADCLKAARRRYHWMRMSHMTVIPRSRVDAQLAARTVTEFMEAEAPRSRAGKVLWHAQPRAAVNLRQLLQTDTVEFRHFPATLCPDEVTAAADWCRDYMLTALGGGGPGDAVKLFRRAYAGRLLPVLHEIYDHRQETRWLATTPTRNDRPAVAAAIARILEEDGYDPRTRTAVALPAGGRAAGSGR